MAPPQPIARIKVPIFACPLPSEDRLVKHLKTDEQRQQVRKIHQVEQVDTLAVDVIRVLAEADKKGLGLFDSAIISSIRSRVGTQADAVSKKLRLEAGEIKRLSDSEVRARLAFDVITGKGFGDLAFLLREKLPKQRHLLETVVREMDLATLFNTLNSGYYPGVPSRKDMADFIRPLRSDYDDLLLTQANSVDLVSCPATDDYIDNDESQDDKEDNFLALVMARPVEGEPAWVRTTLIELVKKGFTGDHNGTSLNMSIRLLWDRYKDPALFITMIGECRDSDHWKKILRDCCSDETIRSSLLPSLTTLAKDDSLIAAALFSSILEVVSSQAL